MFAQRSNPLLYLWARSRWIIRLRDMTPSLKNIAWLKLFCSMFLIMMMKKVFVEVSIIIMVVVLSFVWFMDWTDRFIRGALGFFDIFLRSVFVPKNFGFSDWVFIMDFPSFSIWFSVFVINTCLMGFGFGFQCGFVYAPLVNTVSDRSGFWKLRCEHLKILTVLHEVFGFDRIFLRFCGCG